MINNVGGKCLVLSWMPSPIDEGVKIPVFQSFGTFRERYSNRYISIEDKNKPVGTYWLKHRDRRTFEGIDLVPDGPEILSGNILNLWGGWGVEAKAGDWSLMRRHVETILANGDPDFADYILRWSAWAVQNPGTPAEVALVLQGEKGSGKGTWFVALRRIFGPHGLHIASSKHLTGSFNGHTRNCLFLFADEAFWARRPARRERAKGNADGVDADNRTEVRGRGTDQEPAACRHGRECGLGRARQSR